MKYPVQWSVIFIALIITGCSHSTELTGKYPPDDKGDVPYSIIYYIHADSDYLFHNSDGEPVRENANVLTTAFEVAEESRSGEVFIYYQRPETKILGLFPQKESRLYHYKYGQLITQVNYRHSDKKEAFLATEAQLLNQYRTNNVTEGHQNYFFYFGHEIPLENGKGYHQTLPNIDVNTASFANGIRNFLLPNTDRFDLVILSTCNNGSPAMAEALLPVTDAMLASPQNLHLSHFDSRSMALLEAEPDATPLQLGYSIAEQTFQRLEATTQTTITLALYDFQVVQDYIHTLTSHLAAHKFTDHYGQFQDNVDCAMTHQFEFGTHPKGVKTWYKPARFGRQSDQFTHSGWGCKPSGM